MKALPPNSVGVVVPETVRLGPIDLQCGIRLPHFEIVYETYGELNDDRSNAILICHALSGHHHAAGFHSMDDDKPGWWDVCIGPGKAIDTNRYFVVSLNNLGGCHGSTGPRSIDPATGEPYGPTFPTVTVKDWVRTQAMLADALGIEAFAAIAGGSLGGMQAMQWAIDFPDRVRHALLIACASKLSAQNIAFNEIARQAIVTDPQYHEGNYLKVRSNPDTGLRLARMLGHVTYLSDDSMGDRFGRELKSGDIASGHGVEFQVESYLNYQGTTFSKVFDANTYLLMTRALDYFDPARDHGDDLVKALGHATCKFLVISFSTDWRFAPERSVEIIDALIAARRDVVSANIEATHGHDSFLLPVPRYLELLSTYLDRVASECGQ